MESIILQVQNLTKRYNKQITAVDRLNLTIRRGEVYGFLGPNGAGKTTTLKMVLGLIRPTSGTGTVRGKALGTAEGLAGIGALVEAPAFFPHLSGCANLRLLADHAGVSYSQVDRVLETVELTQRANDRFTSYSLGMKQRLGVAAALLKDPELLILDEPTNGLDPKGMADMRALIRHLGQGKRTVLFSSHVLSEVEQICDRVGVIQQGRLVMEGTVADLKGQAQLLVQATPLIAAQRVIEAAYSREQVQVKDEALVLSIHPQRAAEIVRMLVKHEIAVHEVRPVERSLEEIFMQVTEKEKKPTG